MKIEERFVVDAPIERVWTFIMSPEEIGPCVPGCGQVETLDPDRYRATIAVRVGPVETRFNLEVEVEQRREPCFAAFVTRGEEGGRASRLSARSTLALERLDGGRTEVAYASDVSVVGRLGTVGLGLMRNKAKSLGAQFAGALRERMRTAQET